MSILTGQPTTPEERTRISSMGNRLKARQPAPAGDLAALIQAAIEAQVSAAVARAVQSIPRQAPAETQPSAESNVVPLQPAQVPTGALPNGMTISRYADDGHISEITTTRDGKPIRHRITAREHDPFGNIRGWTMETHMPDGTMTAHRLQGVRFDELGDITALDIAPLAEGST